MKNDHDRSSRHAVATLSAVPSIPGDTSAPATSSKYEVRPHAAPGATEGADDRAVAVKRTAEMAAIFMIGDRLLGVLKPQRHVDLWRSKYQAVDVLVRPFGQHPWRRRLYRLAQIAADLTIAPWFRTTKWTSRTRAQPQTPAAAFHNGDSWVVSPERALAEQRFREWQCTALA